MAVGCGMALVKVVLGTLNLLVVGCGVALLVIGIFAFIDTQLLSTLVRELTLNSVSISLIVIGACITVVGFLGCAGACFEKRCMLITYAWVVFVLVIVQALVIMSYFFFHNELVDQVKSGFRIAVQEKYNPHDSEDIINKAVDALHEKFDCCGATDYRDWLSSTWRTNHPHDGCEPGPRSNNNCDYAVPISCCNVTETTGCNLANHYKNDTLDSSKIRTKGCVDSLVQWVKDKTMFVGGIITGILLIQIVAMVYAVCLKDEVHTPSKRLEHGCDELGSTVKINPVYYGRVKVLPTVSELGEAMHRVEAANLIRQTGSIFSPSPGSTPRMLQKRGHARTDSWTPSYTGGIGGSRGNNIGDFRTHFR